MSMSTGSGNEASVGISEQNVEAPTTDWEAVVAMLLGKLKLQEDAFEHFQSRVQRLVIAMYVELSRQRMKASNAIYLKEFYRTQLQQRDAASREVNGHSEVGDGRGVEPDALDNPTASLRHRAFQEITAVPENLLSISAEGRVIRSALADLNANREPDLDSMLVMGMANYLEYLNL